MITTLFTLLASMAMAALFAAAFAMFDAWGGAQDRTLRRGVMAARLFSLLASAAIYAHRFTAWPIPLAIGLLAAAGAFGLVFRRVLNWAAPYPPRYIGTTKAYDRALRRIASSLGRSPWNIANRIEAGAVLLAILSAFTLYLVTT